MKRFSPSEVKNKLYRLIRSEGYQKETAYVFLLGIEEKPGHVQNLTYYNFIQYRKEFKRCTEILFTRVIHIFENQ